MGVRWLAMSVAGAMVLGGLTAPPTAAAATPCGAGGNAVACENSKPGDSPDVWDITGAGDATIQGFATTTSVAPGETVKFKIKAASSFNVDIYRLGYYQGLGARRQATGWTVNNPAVQPACATDPSTYNYDCGTWSVSTQWAVPSTSVSGIYIAKLTMGGDVSQIAFVVRGSNSSDVLFKTSDATWQAYNTYGGADFYTAPASLSGSQARAFKISYNRPYNTRNDGGRDYLFSNEYPTLRFLERNGIDVSYTTDVDVSTGTSPVIGHKVFLSVGHDEYWTKAERDSVESARDNGVNLAFLSGNEVYWHTQLAPSIDGSNTANRTIVCYKDSWDPAQINPSGEATPTWRDPAYAAPDGSRPENSLTGTAFMTQSSDLAITVSATEGKTRFWRNTSLASLPAGSSVALAPHTVGYESDEDLDNGFRPAGLMHLSTTTGPVLERVTNLAGTKVGTGQNTTHNLTLYRAPSGALVFGAGTVQWGWGLDQAHDGDNSSPADPRMQQATLNILADMGVQPTTLMSGMVMPTASTDHQAPTVTVTTPTQGANLSNGAQVTVSGAASENGGGVVTVVEVSLDGGATYQRATGTTSWSYSGVLAGIGPSAIKVRANDDSANLSTPVSVSVSVACPCSLFGAQTPTTPSIDDSSAVELGVKFKASADGFVSGIRFFKGSGNTGTHTGTLWSSSGTPLASGVFVNETASGWQTLVFPNNVPITGGETYVASYFAPAGHYAGDSQYFTASDHVATPLTAPGHPSSVSNGVYAFGHNFPSSSYQDTNYWVDVLYSRDDTTPPTVVYTSPFSNATSVSTTVRPTATFAGSIDPATLVMGLKDTAGNAVAGTTTFDGPNRTARFTPAAPLSHGAGYTASVRATSAAGVAMPAAYTWSFVVSQTDPLPGFCPCSIWTDDATPATASIANSTPVELGVKFQASVDGLVTGIRFYKGPLNVGTHTGTLWSATGTPLATLTFVGESSTGWQTGYFTNPVDITAGTTYIVSYQAPNGGYAVTANGLSSPVVTEPLSTIATGGVYTYGSGAPLSSSTTNYWVDVVFMANDAAPLVAATSPGSDSTNVNVSATVSAAFRAQVQTGSAQLSVATPTGGSLPGTVSYSATTRTITFTPSAPLAEGTTYTATVSGATALSGNQMSPFTFSFTTAGVSSCPCTLFESAAQPATVDSGDLNGVEVGVSFSSTVNGIVRGVRFYKGALNTGTHVGNLWSATGSLLATGTFTGESASGWQTLTFANPIEITAGTSYVVSYYAPNGHYATTGGFFSSGYTNGPLVASSANGLYRYGSSSGFPQNRYGAANYWVDPIFTTGSLPDVTPPEVSAVSPIQGATSQSAAVTPSATFSEAIATTSLGFTLKAADGSNVSGTTAYDSTTRTATFTPAAALTRGATYTATVTSVDLAGNAQAAPRTWSFMIARPDPTPGTCPCSLWTDATTPSWISVPDAAQVELGTQFSADRNGAVSGVRFYKSAENLGTHTISLWSTAGTLLATATVGNESSTGWQTASFATAVPVTAGTQYVVSYNAPVGRYSATTGGLGVPVVQAPLSTLAGAGRYLYGAGFPSNVSNANYWVDPVFTDTAAPPADTTPPTVSAVVATGSATSAVVTWTTDESSTSSVAYGTSATSLTSTATGASGTRHSVTVTGLASGTTYYYRVNSADTAGNAATSPAAPAAPASFATTDVTPPTVSTVVATGSGTSAVVTWTTDESSTSSVAYGTSATSLTSTATGASGTSHSVTLTGLTSNTRYYYRVTSADPAGNSTTTPATSAAAARYVPTVTPVTHSSVADFSTGSGGYVADSAGGEVMGTPGTGYEFAGTTLPSGVASTTLVTGGSSTVAGGTVTVSGSQLAPTATSTSGKNLTVSATMAPGQVIAWGSTNGGMSGKRAAFVMSSSGALSVVANDGLVTNRTTAIAGTYTGAAHEYRIDWTSSSVTFYVDGVQKATGSFFATGSLRPMLVDPVVDTSPLEVDWLRVGPYAASSTYTSPVVDAGATVGWDVLTRDVDTPTGTSVTIQVRSGNTPTPGTGWTGWSTIAPATGSMTRSARYVQYRIVLTTSGTRYVSPAARAVALTYHVL